MTFRFFILGAFFIGITVAGPIGLRDDVTPNPDAELSTSTAAIAVVDTLNVELDNSTDLALGNETHLRQKRSCGCCCCRPCCCCCRPCCCCCRCCCCCCCRCCCRCCCCRPCCCCCRPCCGCCGCGGRKRRSIQQLTHKLMDKQAAAIRQYQESAESVESTTTTEAPVVLSNAQIDAFGRNYGNIAFADLTNFYKVPENLPQYQDENF